MMTLSKSLVTAAKKTSMVIITMILWLITFAYAQNCTLPLGWTPATLTDGQSRTGYYLSGATFTQSCAQSAALLRCTSGSISPSINIFKYPSCTQQTWANCTTPTQANHLEYRLLYRSPTNTHTQTCQQLSQNLQCLNGVFTWWTTPSAYIYTWCITQNWAQCLEVRTNTIRNHGEVILWYTTNTPPLGHTCSTLQKNLICTNGTRSGNGNAWQAWLVSSCTNPPAFSWCMNTRHTPSILVPHNSSLNAYTSPTSTVWSTCSAILRPLTCINGLRSGNGNNQQQWLYSWCVEANTAPCTNIGWGTGIIPHGSFATVFTQPFAFEANGQNCTALATNAQCINGTRSWYSPWMSTGCTNVSSGSCFNNLTNRYIGHLQQSSIYTSQSPTAGFGCDSAKLNIFCNAWIRRSWSVSGSPLWASLAPTYFGNCGWCVLPRWAQLVEWSSITWYARTAVTFPETCNSFSTKLTCGSGWVIEWNRQTHNKPSCSVSWWLVTGKNITINESPVIANYQQIAQWSSPEITIVFWNKWNTPVEVNNIVEGFLQCKRSEENIGIYRSRPIETFNLQPGTKLGISIRLQSLFTQALGKKTVVCMLNWSMINDNYPNQNKTRTGTFEVVEAKRFDLALSRSIDPISKNLESAEWATSTDGLRNFVFDKIMNVLVPLIVIIGILSAILWFYKLMFSNDENATKEATRYIAFGVIGILFIMSAKFIGQNVFDLLNPNSWEIKWFEMAQGLYDRILYPFIKLAIYLVLWAMFVILISRVITFIFGSDSDTQKKAGTLIWRNVVSMLVIIGAKQIVEAIYGKQQDVVKDITNLWEIWSGILESKNIPLIWQLLNYALGIASLVILIIIIIQTVKLLTKPDDPAQVKNIKNSLMYMFIGILVLWGAYLIVNFAIIN